MEQVQRLVEVAVVDTFQLENSVSRNRTLAYLAQTALKLLEVGEHEARMKPSKPPSDHDWRRSSRGGNGGERAEPQATG